MQAHRYTTVAQLFVLVVALGFILAAITAVVIVELFAAAASH